MSESTAIPEANSAVTVTVAAPPSSGMEVCCPGSELVSTFRLMVVGAASSSMMVTPLLACCPNTEAVNLACSTPAS